MPKNQPPKYALHKSSGHARCRINGRDVFLGPYDSPESRERYAKLVEEWLAENGDQSQYVLTNDQLALAYLEHAKLYYVKDGQQTGHVDVIKAALRFLVRRVGPERAHDFTPRKLKQARDAMVAEGLSRNYVNTLTSIIKRAFKWAASEGLVSGNVVYALQSVSGLRKGRSKARETDPVVPVDECDVEAVLPHLPRPVAAMVELQRLTGMRPGEAMVLRPCDVTIRTDGLWTYRPGRHKTEHHEQDRVVFIGERGQDVLRPWMECEPSEFCFSPPGPNRPYSKNAYRRAIERGCEVAFGMPKHLRTMSKKLPTAERNRLKAEAREWRQQHCWAPNQLRHLHGTRVRREYGLEAAQVILGHSKADVTQVYAERDFELAASIQKRIG